MSSDAKQPYWRDAFASGEIIQRVRPQHTDELLINPHKGTTTFQRFNGDPLYPDLRWNDSKGPEEFPPPVNADLHNDRYLPTTISYCRWVWKVLEPEKGKFRFDFIDKALETAAARGQTLQIRTQPFTGSAPEWYWETGADYDEIESAKRQSKVPDHNGQSKVPDHNDPLYLKHWGDHIRALGERYNGHPSLESFDVAYGGSCGETGGNASCISSRRLAQIYVEAFPDTQLVTMLGTEGCTYLAKQPSLKAGWRADCFGDLSDWGHNDVPDGLAWNHMRDLYPSQHTLCGVQDSWKTGPITFETCYTVPYWLNKGWDIDWIIEQGLKYHISVFMPKSVYFPEEWMDKLKLFNNRMGYWYHLHNMILPLEVRRGHKFEVIATIDNRGVAPLYRPYKFAFRFSQGDKNYIVKFHHDVRTWMPELTHFIEHIQMPAELQPGEVKVSCAIVNAKDKPVVRLAIKNIDAEGWHRLASMDVLE